MVGLKKIHRWNFRELVRPRGFEPLTFASADLFEVKIHAPTSSINQCTL